MTKKMHLLDMTLFYAPESGGVKRYLSAKHGWLQGHKQVTNTLLVPGETDTPWQSGGTVTLASPSLPFGQGYRLPLNLPRWSRAIRALDPDIIEAADPYHLAWLAQSSAKKLNIPVLGFYHSDLPRLLSTRFGNTAQRLAGAYIKRLFRGFDRVLAPSQVMVDRLGQLGLHQVRHQPLGVDTAVFRPELKCPLLRKQLGLPETTRLLIYAGRFSPEKKLPVLMEALRILGKPYHLLLVGGGMEIPAQANVTAWPYRSDTGELARHLASCDVLVHPGDQETFGLVVLEALACGLPVIGMAAGGVAELVDPEVGLLVPPLDAPALAEAITAIYQSDLQQLGLNARHKVEQHYSWDRIMPQLLGHYASLLGWGAERLPEQDIPELNVAN